jgi:hypothetical protein
MEIFKSRYTPNLKNGKDVGFSIGDMILYKPAGQSPVRAKIVSDRRSHKSVDKLGYDAIFADDGNQWFAVEEQIIDWEGKVK